MTTNINYNDLSLTVTGTYQRGCKATRINPPEPEYIEDLTVLDSGGQDITELFSDKQLEKIQEIALTNLYNDAEEERSFYQDYD